MSKRSCVTCHNGVEENNPHDKCINCYNSECKDPSDELRLCKNNGCDQYIAWKEMENHLSDECQFRDADKITHVEIIMSTTQNMTENDCNAEIIVNNNNVKTTNHIARLENLLDNLSDTHSIINISHFQNLIINQDSNNGNNSNDNNNSNNNGSSINENNIKLFTSIMKQLNGVLNKSNQEIMKEIPLIMETQKFEPNDSNKTQLCKDCQIWDYLNKSIESYIDIIETYLQLKNEFLFVFYLLMFKPSNIYDNKLESKILNLIEKSENYENEETKEETTKHGESLSFEYMKKVESQLCGYEYIDQLYQSSNLLNNTADKPGVSIIDNNELEMRQIEKKIEEIENVLKPMIEEYNKVNNEKEEWYTKWLNNSENDTYKVKCQMLDKALSEKKEAINVYYNKIESIINQHNNKLNEIELLRNKLSLPDSEIKLFILSIENASQYTKTIAIRCGKFKSILKLLLQMVSKYININDITISWYFKGKQISQFIKPLNDENIFTIKQFKQNYNDIDSLNKQLFPYLKTKMNRNLTVAEKNKLKSIVRKEF